MVKLFHGALALLIVVVSAKSVMSAGCTNVIAEASAGVLNWLGEVTFIVPVNTNENGWTMSLQFDVAYTGVGVWDVWANSDGHASGLCKLTNRDYNAVLKAGDEFFFRFRVNYFTNVTKPKVTSLTFQGIELCK